MDFFQSVYIQANINVVSIKKCQDQVLFNPPIICVEDVTNVIHDLKSTFSPGPIMEWNLTNILWYLFNLSLKISSFPEYWKSSFIPTLFKSGDKKIISNYRGIAKLNCIPKLFEAILAKDLNFKLKKIYHHPNMDLWRKIYIYKLTFTSHISSSAFKEKLQTDVGYFDFSKPFDQINHQILLRKLS